MSELRRTTWLSASMFAAAIVATAATQAKAHFVCGDGCCYADCAADASANAGACDACSQVASSQRCVLVSHRATSTAYRRSRPYPSNKIRRMGQLSVRNRSGGIR
jgi:hypothetical protein